MRRRPLTLILLSLALIFVAVSFPLQIILIYGHTLGEMDAVFAKLTTLNWLVILGCLVCSALVAEASPLCRKAMLGLTLLIACNNFIVGYYAIDYAPVLAWAGTLAFALLNLPLYSTEIRKLIRHPEKRWWRRAERCRRSIPVVITGALGGRSPVRAETFDFSDSGVFIALPDSHFDVEDRIAIRLTFGSFSQVRCEGKVVRRTEDVAGGYPSGIGIQFMDLDWRQRQELRRQIGRDL